MGNNKLRDLVIIFLSMVLAVSLTIIVRQRSLLREARELLGEEMLLIESSYLLLARPDGENLASRHLEMAGRGFAKYAVKRGLLDSVDAVSYAFGTGYHCGLFTNIIDKANQTKLDMEFERLRDGPYRNWCVFWHDYGFFANDHRWEWMDWGAVERGVNCKYFDNSNIFDDRSLHYFAEKSMFDQQSADQTVACGASLSRALDNYLRSGAGAFYSPYRNTAKSHYFISSTNSLTGKSGGVLGVVLGEKSVKGIFNTDAVHPYISEIYTNGDDNVSTTLAREIRSALSNGQENHVD